LSDRDASCCTKQEQGKSGAPAKKRIWEKKKKGGVIFKFNLTPAGEEAIPLAG